MRRYGGADTSDLLETRWSAEKSARCYEHVVVTEAARLSDHMPVVDIKKVG
ncbi:hypothetical protein [Rhodoplanes sp. Z2-YC6860]|uniref:hypothetical protein n=1 Tax=Rhodoplanes sp. Z2-YC6860 TaxID=674703 RepID=UPI0012EED240|nr:hypothetical protein [Rhodoplanes sp. Z2-YC6860]